MFSLRFQLIGCPSNKWGAYKHLQEAGKSGVALRTIVDCCCRLYIHLVNILQQQLPLEPQVDWKCILICDSSFFVYPSMCFINDIND